MLVTLNAILNNLLNNDFSCLTNVEYMNLMSNKAISLISNTNWLENDIACADLLIKISNIAYNNTSLTVLPLDDGVYDQLLVVYKQYNPNYQVGSYQTNVYESAENQFEEKKIMCRIATESGMFYNDIWKFTTPLSEMVPKTMCVIDGEPITKRLINTTHKYPELVGTLDKCKFVLNAQAREAEVFDKPSIQIFERDFIHKCIDLGVISTDEVFEMVAELKYDGISVEAEVCGDTIISALSRGDTADNIATDLTPIFGGYKFHMAKDVPTDITFGIKFEAVITNFNLSQLSMLRGKSYKNGRNAIIGLCGASDARKFAHYITLIPLATSLDMDRETELKFLNKYYHSGEYNRYSILRGNYQTILYQVDQFTKSAEAVRLILPYMIDGVVISFTDKNKIAALGRMNSVNKYSMAIKFNPRSVNTIFLGYTYTIGKTGEVIPMVHFKPCEFIGGIHSKQTIHSYARFKELNLTPGEEINVSYVNDVITYVTKVNNEYNRSIKPNPVEFIKKCPYCGSDIIISESGKSAMCPNNHCYERNIMRMIDCLSRLGFKDFSEETVRTLEISSFVKLMNLDPETSIRLLGPNTGSALIHYINMVKTTPIKDYVIMSALGFNGIAEATWKLILGRCTVKELFSYNPEQMHSVLRSIKGIGNKTVNIILNDYQAYKNDVDYVLNNITLIDTLGSAPVGPRVVMTGFRDKEYIELLRSNGFDADDSYSLTKDTKALIAADKNANSSKINKARSYGIPVYSKSEFLELNNIVLN